MSKIGKKFIDLPEGVTVEIDGGQSVVSGPRGKISLPIPSGIEIKIEDKSIKLTLKDKNKNMKKIYGTTRAKLANAVSGVFQGFSKQLELVGTGYRAEAIGRELVLTIGYSHPVKIEAPENLSFKVEKNVVTVEGIDKETVGLVAAKIRAARPPEPYQGKGIKYVNEIIRRKAGKAAKTVGAAA